MIMPNLHLDHIPLKLGRMYCFSVANDSQNMPYDVNAVAPNRLFTWNSHIPANT